MRHMLVLVAALAGVGGAQGPPQAVVHVTATVTDAEGTPHPVARHVLLVSDNPATSTPRRVVTSPRGTVDIPVRAGTYTIESDRPFVFEGRAYEWTRMIEVAAGGDVALALTGDNAAVMSTTAVSGELTPAAAPGDATALLATWQTGIVSVWSPTAHATGFLVGAGGLVATDRLALGGASTVEVQLSDTVKVPGTVLSADATRDVAVLRINEAVVAGASPVPVSCPPGLALSLDERQAITAIVAAPRRGIDAVSGAITGLAPRLAAAEIAVPPGGSGGPVFNEAGAVVGLTSFQGDEDGRRRRDVAIVRLTAICDALAAAASRMPSLAPPPATRLPVEPARGYPANAVSLDANASPGAATPMLSSSAFEVALITPPAIRRAQEKADWTGGRGGRAVETEARIGPLTDFGDWSDYFADLPAVLVVRATPRLVEGFWKRLAREAARTQGAVLPAFKDFSGDFLRMRATCGGTEVIPLHPFVLEHRLSAQDLLREGLYVFAPDAFAPACGTVTLSLYTEKAPDKTDTLTLDTRMLERLWQDFAPFRLGAP